MTTAAHTRHSISAVLGVPNFRKLWIGQIISQIGDGLSNLAAMIVVNQLTGSTTALAGMTIAIALPQLLFGLLAGVFVDRWDRRKIMIVSDLLRGLLVLGLALVRRPEQVWIFYVLGFAQATVGTFFNPAKSALIPQILGRKDLLAANALSQTTQVITLVIGEALAGFLVGLAGGGWPAFTLDALSFFVSAMFIAKIVMPDFTGEEAPALRNGRESFSMLWEGIRYIAGQRILLGMGMTLVVTMLGVGSLNVLFIPFLTRVIHVPTTWMGVLGAGQVAGMIVGSGLIGFLASRFRNERIITLAALGMGACTVLLGFSRDVPGFIILMFGVGLFMSPFNAAISTITQTYVPGGKLGRVSSAVHTVMSLTSVISMGFAGGLGDIIAIPTIFIACGMIIMVAGGLSGVMMRGGEAVGETGN